MSFSISSGGRLSRPDSARLILVADQPTARATSPALRLPRSLRSSAASRRRRTVGLPDGGISSPPVAEAAHVISVPPERASVSRPAGCFSKSHVVSIDKNFTTADYQSRDKGFPNAEELRNGDQTENAPGLCECRQAATPAPEGILRRPSPEATRARSAAAVAAPTRGRSPRAGPHKERGDAGTSPLPNVG